jgi:hypothetical protein
MCDYCERGKRIETEVDNEGYLLVFDADPEYHADGWTVDIYRRIHGNTDGDWLLSFTVPRCPMCGARAGR